PDGKQATQRRVRGTPFHRSKESKLSPPSTALRSISSGQYQSLISPCRQPSAKEDCSPPAPLPRGPVQSKSAASHANRNGCTPSMHCPALTIRSDLNTMLILSVCGILQQGGPAAPCRTLLHSLLPSLALAAAEVAASVAAACSPQQSAQHQPQQEGAPTHSMSTTAAAAIGAVTAAVAAVQQLTPSLCTTSAGGESEATTLGKHIATGNPYPPLPAGLTNSDREEPVQQGNGSAEGETSREPRDTSNEAHRGPLEPLLCTYCGQPRPCAAPCPLGVALTAIQGLHPRGNYCTGRFRVCCYISQPRQQQQQQQQQRVLLSTSQSSPSLASSPALGSEQTQGGPLTLGISSSCILS
ncbi:hypothetical protein DUNSADRAFT_15342, partial [Dunaliella salina]